MSLKGLPPLRLTPETAAEEVEASALARFHHFALGPFAY